VHPLFVKLHDLVPAHPLFRLLITSDDDYERLFCGHDTQLSEAEGAVRLCQEALETCDSTTGMQTTMEGFLQHVRSVSRRQLARSAFAALLPGATLLRFVINKRLADTFRCCFFRTMHRPNLHSAVDHRREALLNTSLVNEGSDRALDALKPTALLSLADDLCHVFQYFQDKDALEEAIARHREMIQIVGPLDISGSVSYSCALLLRFDFATNTADLEEAILHLRRAVNALPEGHGDRDRALNNLGSALRCRHTLTGHNEDLADAIHHHTRVLELRPSGHELRSSALTNLANDLKRSGKPDDLERYVDLRREQVQLHVPGTPEYGLGVLNLANGLLERFQSTKAVSFLNEAITRYREALRLYRRSGLKNMSMVVPYLANALAARGGHDCELEAASLYKEAIASSHVIYNTVADARTGLLKLRLRNNGPLFDLFGAVKLLQDIISDHGLGPIDRARESIDHLRRLSILARYRPERYGRVRQHLMPVFVDIIGLLPQVAHLGLDLPDRLKCLAGFDFISRMAGAHALLLQDVPCALELLEQGRCVFWSQALHLRGSFDMQRLPQADRETLQRLFSLLSQSDRIDSERASRGRDDHDGAQIHEARVAERRCWNLEIDKLTAEIRTRSGCENFLLPASYSQLRRAAIRGPVVVLLEGILTCSAIVMASSETNPFAIELDVSVVSDLQAISGELARARALIRSTKATLSEGQGRMGMKVSSKRPSFKLSQSPFDVQLDKLWTQVVKPIIEALQLKVNTNHLRRALMATC
jgi:tetratricopeptide (TPR) repeat protein